jgi:Protein of unknown function (DUF2844)
MKFCVSIAALMLAGPAAAELGGNADTVSADQTHMRASLRVAGAARYSVHEMQTPEGTTVREYVSPAGTVFAVAWQGPMLPDLQQLLGAYFGRYADAVAEPRNGRGPVSIALPDLIVQSGGHMRAFTGRAYLPEQIPNGVELNEIR